MSAAKRPVGSRSRTDREEGARRGQIGPDNPLILWLELDGLCAVGHAGVVYCGILFCLMGHCDWWGG